MPENGIIGVTYDDKEVFFVDREVINAALGNEKADLLLKGGHVVNVFSGEIEKRDVLIKNGRVAAC